HEPQEDEQEGKEGEEALALRAEDQPPKEEVGAEGDTEQRHPDSRERHELDRNEREAGHEVEAELHEAERRVARAPRQAGLVPDRDLRWPPRQPGAECGNEERALGQAEYLRDHRA